MKKINFLVILLTIFLSNQVFACLCNGKWTVREGFKTSEIILVGTIISYQYTNTISSFKEDKIKNDSIKWSPELFSIPLAKYEMQVEKVYKGVSIKDTISILTGLGGDDCGYNFSIDERYIIYGSMDFVYIFVKNDPTFKQTEVIWTNRCKGTKLYKSEEIDEIEKIIAEIKGD